MRFELTILGSSSALPTSTKFPSAHVLNIHERLFLIDCGEGTQIQLRRANIRFGKINHIFITHMHGDHVFGLFGVLSTFNLLGRKLPLHIYGPAELKVMIDFYTKNFTDESTFSVVFNPFTKRELQLIYEDKVLEVFAFPLKHRVPTFGFLFREKERTPNVKKEAIEAHGLSVKQIRALKAGEGIITDRGIHLSHADATEPPCHRRSYAYCSDTMKYEKIVSYIRQVDLLYHEATFLERDKKLAKLTGHATAVQAATIAKKAAVGELIIGHFSNRYRNTEEFLDEAQSVFPTTRAAEDLCRYQFPPLREA
jgi:ribonuclease Z